MGEVLWGLCPNGLPYNRHGDITDNYWSIQTYTNYNQITVGPVGVFAIRSDRIFHR